MRFIHLVVFVLCALMLTGCFFTKVATVPMRLSAAALSVIPVVGDTTHDVIDMAAELVDEVPL